MKILVIDDEEILRTELIEWLMLEGYEAFGAGDGLEGLELAYQHLPDLIICDVMMPLLDGPGMLWELRNNPLTMKVPFIFISASIDNARQSMDLGANDYLTKPFSLLEFQKAVQLQLQKRG